MESCNEFKKEKVVFINPLLNYNGESHAAAVIPYPFPGLMILSALLDRAGYEVKIIDANLYTAGDFEKKLFLEIRDNVAFIGFGLMTMNIPWAYRVMKRIKTEYPDCRIVAGGVHPSLFPDKTIEDEHIDVVVINEAAATITLLADTLLSKGDLGKVPGIYYKESCKIFKNPPNLEPDSFTRTPFINFSLIDHERYARNNTLTQLPYFPRKQYLVYPIQTSFGCAHRCAFCINSIFQRKYRMRPAEEIVGRIEDLQKRYNANFIVFYDEDFFASKKRIMRFVELVEEKNLKFFWRTSLRVEYFKDSYIDEKLLKRLEGIGFMCAVMGGESSSQRILDYLNKGITVQQIRKAVESLSKTKIVPKVSFIVGIPGESEKETLETYRFAISLKKIAKKTDIQVLPFRLYPGSKLYDKAISDYQHKEVAELKEFASINGENMSKGWGYPIGGRKWIKNPARFDLMQFYFNTFISPYYERGGLLRNLFVKMVMARFYINFFHLSFIEKAAYKIFKTLKGLTKTCCMREENSNL